MSRRTIHSLNVTLLILVVIGALVLIENVAWPSSSSSVAATNRTATSVTDHNLPMGTDTVPTSQWATPSAATMSKTDFNVNVNVNFAVSSAVALNSTTTTTATTTTAPTSTTTTAPTTTTTTAPTTTTTAPTTTTTVRNRDPFSNAQISTFLNSRDGVVTAGLYDVATGQTYLYNPGVREVTASMVKIDILATLLNECEAKHRTLSAAEASLAQVMIEDSDNSAAQKLWNDIGGFGLSTRLRGTGGYYAIASFNRRVGFTQTLTGWGWGTMDTTPADFLKLLRVIWRPSPLLTSADQSYERRLMENVISSQRFGIPDGVPKGALVGVKDGDYPESTTGQQVNSAGYVHLGRVTYMAVVMTRSDPDETYGIDTVNGLGILLWQFESRLAAIG